MGPQIDTMHEIFNYNQNPLTTYFEITFSHVNALRRDPNSVGSLHRLQSHSKCHLFFRIRRRDTVPEFGLTYWFTISPPALIASDARSSSLFKNKLTII